MTDAKTLLDMMLDEFESSYRAMEHGITVAPEHLSRTPLDGNELRREVNGRDGAYKGPVYRDSLITTPEGLNPDVVIVSPIAGTIPEADNADTLWGNLATGAVETAYDKAFPST